MTSQEWRQTGNDLEHAGAMYQYIIVENIAGILLQYSNMDHLI